MQYYVYTVLAVLYLHNTAVAITIIVLPFEEKKILFRKDFFVLQLRFNSSDRKSKSFLDNPLSKLLLSIQNWMVAVYNKVLVNQI